LGKARETDQRSPVKLHGWSLDELHTTSYTFTMPSANLSLIAHFK
jgi:hypothetical protein